MGPAAVRWPRRFGTVLRAAALALLAPLGCAPAHDVQDMFRGLRSPDLEVRQEAAEKLEAIVAQGDYQTFVRGLRSPDRIFRAQSMVYLARVSGKEARRALRDQLRLEQRALLPWNPIKMKPASEETDSRILAANLIAEAGGDPEAVEVLTAGIEDQAPAIFASTCFALGALGDPKAIPALARATRRPDVEVARAAVQALGRFRQPEARQALMGALDHPSVEVRSDVLSSLELAEDPSQVDIYKKVAVSDPSPELRAEAVRQLGRFKDPGLVPFLIDQLRGKDEAPRQAALSLLGQLTGRSLGPRPEAWSRWWSQNQKSRPAGR